MMIIFGIPTYCLVTYILHSDLAQPSLSKKIGQKKVRCFNAIPEHNNYTTGFFTIVKFIIKPNATPHRTEQS